jgi:O-antigen/teichoic acid export membrane protein
MLQFGYAAVTSRLVSDAGFGAYAVSLSVTALITLLANGGLGQTVGRMMDLVRERISALALYAVAMGVLGAAILLTGADFIAQFWATPAAADPIRILAVAALLSPLSGLLAGLIRRQQRFRLLALSVVAANVTGMAVGVVAVVLEPGPIALVISPTVAAIILTGLMIVLNWSNVFAKPGFRAVKGELRFSWKVTGLSVISYLNVNLGRWALARGPGVDVLGQWNRAEVLTTVPLEQAHRALQQAIYPEFRHDIDRNSRTQQVWTDLLVLLAWAAFPLAAIAGAIAPFVIPILFGSNWNLAGVLALPLALIFGIQTLFTTLSSALEAVNLFRWVVPTHLIGLAVQVIGATYAIAIRDWVPVIAALGISLSVQHVIQLVFCRSGGLLDVSRLLRGYLSASVAAALLGGSAWALFSALRGDLNAWMGVAALLLMVTSGFLAWLWRSRLPPATILRRYQLR